MKKTLDQSLSILLILLMVVITFDVLLGVFTRYVIGNQPGWTEELARFLLIWISIFGAAYAAGQHQHLAIDLISTSLSPSRDKQLKTFVNMLVAIFVFSVFIIGGSRLIYITAYLGQTSPALKIPMSVVYGVIPVSGICILLYMFASKQESNRIAANFKQESIV
ncbi:MAG: TRAP transporter small permease [Saprospiraceae bacterium]|nr:TRAP transporter small permease [Saprospiraceae bacterium]